MINYQHPGVIISSLSSLFDVGITGFYWRGRKKSPGGCNRGREAEGKSSLWHKGEKENKWKEREGLSWKE